MKKSINRFYIASFVLSFLMLTGCKSKEISVAEQAKINRLTEKIDAQRYEFTARNANPMNFKTINLDPGYTLKITPDTITAYLPYFGRAYTAPINPSEGGIKFTSTNFDYEKKAKKDGWEIKIDTKDTKGNVNLFMNIGNTGYATINVRDNDRQAISFYGTIDE